MGYQGDGIQCLELCDVGYYYEEETNRCILHALPEKPTQSEGNFSEYKKRSLHF